MQQAKKRTLELLLSIFKDYGVIGVLVVIIILIVQNPDRADKLQTMILTPLFRCFRVGTKQYIAAKVSSTVNEFIKRDVCSILSSHTKSKIQVKWVINTERPAFKQDGTLVLRMQETNDQYRNIISAAQAALPYSICTTIRPVINNQQIRAIDLTILKKLSERLGKRATVIFNKYFLSPETEKDVDLRPYSSVLLNLINQEYSLQSFLKS